MALKTSERPVQAPHDEHLAAQPSIGMPRDEEGPLRPVADDNEVMRPIVFDGMTGWLHVPAAGLVKDVGVLLCAPLGRDGRCAHLPMRLLADRLAARGYAVLRYDHLGTADALDSPSDGDELAGWIAGVASAAAALRASTGLQRLVIGGLRIGASLAAVAAQDLTGIEGLILLAPVVTGRAWLRELTLSAALGPVAPANETGGLISNGFELSAQTVRSLSSFDLRKLARAPARVLLVDPPSWTSKASAIFTGLDAELTQGPFDGYEALFDEAHSNKPPYAVFDQVETWLAANLPEVRAEPLALKRLSATQVQIAGGLERPVKFGKGLRGVLTLPDRPDRRAKAVVFCNTGGDPRVGSGRFSALAARTLAREGYASLRFDFAGLGDSPAEDGDRSHVYETSRAVDLSDAVTVLTEAGFPHITLAGVCSGAYHVLWSAVRDTRVEGAFVVSLLKFVWRTGDSLDIGKRDTAGASSLYIQGLRDPHVWKRLIRGDIQVWAITRSLTRRFADRLVRRRDQAATARMKVDIASLSSRKARLHMLLGVHDAALDELEMYYGAMGQRLAAQPGMSVSVVPGLDHGLMLTANRNLAITQLLDVLGE
jgi:pimeloyl-ACP methyl ester carboxylesterase